MKPRIKTGLAWLAACVFMLSQVVAQHEEALNAYLEIYAIFDQAQQHDQIGNIKEALTGYQQMVQELDAFRIRYPGWQEQVVQYRRQYAMDRIRVLSGAVETESQLPAASSKLVSEGGGIEVAPYQTRQVEGPVLKDILTTFQQQMTSTHEHIKTLIAENSANHKQIIEMSTRYADASARLELTQEKIDELNRQRQQLIDENQALKDALSESFSSGRLQESPKVEDAHDSGMGEVKAPVVPLVPENSAKQSTHQSNPTTSGKTSEVNPYPAKSSAPSNMLPDDYAEMMQVQKMEAKLLREKNQLDLAKKAWQDIAKTSPNDPDVWLEMGITYIMAKDLENAEKSLRHSVQLSPDNAAAHANLGFVLYESGKLDDSTEHLQKAIKKENTLAPPHNYLGMIHFKRGDAKAAEESLMKAIEINPEYGDALYNLAVVNIVRSPPDKSKALKFYQQAVGAGVPSDPELEKLLR